MFDDRDIATLTKLTEAIGEIKEVLKEINANLDRLADVAEAEQPAP